MRIQIEPDRIQLSHEQTLTQWECYQISASRARQAPTRNEEQCPQEPLSGASDRVALIRPPLMRVIGS